MFVNCLFAISSIWISSFRSVVAMECNRCPETEMRKSMELMQSRDIHFGCCCVANLPKFRIYIYHSLLSVFNLSLSLSLLLLILLIYYWRLSYLIIGIQAPNVLPSPSEHSKRIDLFRSQTHTQFIHIYCCWMWICHNLFTLNWVYLLFSVFFFSSQFVNSFSVIHLYNLFIWCQVLTTQLRMCNSLIRRINLSFCLRHLASVSSAFRMHFNSKQLTRYDYDEIYYLWFVHISNCEYATRVYGFCWRRNIKSLIWKANEDVGDVSRINWNLKMKNFEVFIW